MTNEMAQQLISSIHFLGDTIKTTGLLLIGSVVASLAILLILIRGE